MAVLSVFTSFGKSSYSLQSLCTSCLLCFLIFHILLRNPWAVTCVMKCLIGLYDFFSIMLLQWCRRSFSYRYLMLWIISVHPVMFECWLTRWKQFSLQMFKWIASSLTWLNHDCPNYDHCLSSLHSWMHIEQ